RRHIGPNVILWFVTRRQILFLFGGGRLRMHQQHSKTIGSVIGLSKICSIKIYVRLMYDINHKTLRYSISNHMEYKCCYNFGDIIISYVISPIYILYESNYYKSKLY